MYPDDNLNGLTVNNIINYFIKNYNVINPIIITKNELNEVKEYSISIWRVTKCIKCLYIDIIWSIYNLHFKNKICFCNLCKFIRENIYNLNCEIHIEDDELISAIIKTDNLINMEKNN